MSNKQSSSSGESKGILYQLTKWGTFILPPLGLFILFLVATGGNILESIGATFVSGAAIIVVIAILYYQKGGR